MVTNLQRVARAFLFEPYLLLFPAILEQVWDPEGVVIIPDHYIFTADPRANRNVDILRDFVNQQASQFHE